MTTWRRTWILAAAALLAGLPLGAEERVLTFDPSATEVSFELPATGHDVHGVLHLQSGEVRFDPATGAAHGEVTVDARGAETGNGSRDKTMRKKVLETERYPLFVFRPERLEGDLAPEGTSQIALVGTISLHGEDHPMTLPATVEIDGDHLTATATFPVPYVEWGLHNPSLLFLRVADQVQVTVEAQGSLQRGEEILAAHGVERADGE